MTAPGESLKMLNKVAIVTGGCEGIGGATANLLVSEGAKVAVFDINDELGKSLKADKGKGEIFYIHCDMRNEEEIKKAVHKTIDKYGRLDFLLNNVGGFPKPSSLDHFSAQDFRDLLNLNVVSYMVTCKYCLPHLRQSKGNIVNIASLTASRGLRGCVLYSASKGAVLSFTKSLAIDEAEHGVRVNCISPSLVDTPLIRKTLDEDSKKTAEDSCVLRRFASPEEIGRAVLFLVTEGTFCTGAELMCTGGADIGQGLKYSGNISI